LEPHSRRRRERIIKLALDESALSPRELAVRFEGCFVSEASVYRISDDVRFSIASGSTADIKGALIRVAPDL
jgi:hypothetical protein